MMPIGRRRTGRLYPPIALTLLAAAVAIAACDATAVLDGNANRGKGSASPSTGINSTTTPTPSPSGLSGGINDNAGRGSPSPTSSASTAAPGATPTTQPSATFSPTPTPPPASAQYIIMSPTSGLIIHLPPPAGATPLPSMPSTIQLNAEVRLSNGTIDSQAASWTSSDVAVAAVSQTGLVTAKFNTGAAKITAVSADGQASESLTVTVKSVGDVSVEVE